MKHLTLLFTAAVSAIAVIACNPEEKKVNNDPAELVSFQILKENNDSTITNDISVDQISDEMILRIVGGGANRTFVATVIAGENDMIKIGDNIVKNDTITIDGTYPIDIIVTDTLSNLSKAYVLKIGKVLGYSAKLVASYSEADAVMHTDFNFAINPKDGQAYMLYSRKDIGSSTRSASVATFDGKDIKMVGAAAFAGKVKNVGYEAMSFDSNGNLVVALQGGLVNNKVSAFKWNGTSWSTLGEGGEMPRITMCPPAVIFDNSNNPIIIQHDYAGTVAPKYGVVVSKWDGSKWNSSAFNNGTPEIGKTSTSSGLMWYMGLGKIGSYYYGAASFNENPYYIVKVSDGTISFLDNNFVPAGETIGVPYNMQIIQGGSNKVFISLASYSANKMQVYVMNTSTGALTPYADGVAVTFGSTSSDAFSFTVNPENNFMICARKNSAKKVEISFVNEDLKWEHFTEIEGCNEIASSNIATFFFKGKFYVAFIDKTPEGDSTANYLRIYEASLEDDILPE